MKIIHTSDWHLGRSFGPVSLHKDQAAFCDWFVNLVNNEEADLVVIAGDVYDRAIAPVESIELFKKTLKGLLGTQAKVAVIAGNHDGPDRLAPYDNLLDLSDAYIRGGYSSAGEVLTLEFSDGPLDLVMLPFLDPQAAPDDFGLDNGEAGDTDERAARRAQRTHESVLASAIKGANERCTSGRSLAVAHAFVQGGVQTEDSERRLVVGGTGEVSAQLFDGFSYTALGHLHRPQAIDENGRIRYSGTPLPYSFAEDHDKLVLVVNMDEHGKCEVTGKEIPIGRKVQTITGAIDELLEPARHPDARDRFVRAIVTDRKTVLDAKRRLEKVYPYVIEVRLQPADIDTVTMETAIDTKKLQPIEATRTFWEAAEDEEPEGMIDDMLVAAVTAATKEVEA